jgi:ELWxxDGT repeat protein
MSTRGTLHTSAVTLAFLAVSAGVRADALKPVKDLMTTLDEKESSNPQPLAITHPLVTVPGQGVTFFFTASDDRNGRELRKTDGTHTELVKDIHPGPTDSTFGLAANCAGTLVFAVDDGVHGMEPWRSDGTPQGTYLLKDLSPGLDATFIANMRMNGEKLYFDATLKNGNKVLYETDGTPANTKPAHLTGNVRIPSAGQQKETYWVTTNNRPEIWESDGTAAGTVQVSEALPVRNGQTGLWPGNGLFATSTKIYAWVNTENAGSFWQSSLGVVDRKTKKITYILQDMNPNVGDGAFVEVGGKVYFDAASNQEPWANDIPIWVTEGTKASRLWSAQNDRSNCFRHGLFTHGGKVFFMETGYGRDSLFASDGTSVSQIIPWLPATNVKIGPPLNAGSLVYFTVAHGTNELWQSDGTPFGTHAAHGVKSGSTWIVQAGSEWYVDASEPATGQELWRVHGSAGALGTTLVRDIAHDEGSSSPYTIGDIGGKFLFGATVPATGTELYGTDGTDSGTVLVKDISSGAASGNPGALGVVGSNLLMVAGDATHGRELWATAGTDGSTKLVKDINAGTADAAIGTGIVSGGKLFFDATDGKSGSELWVSDGSGAGTKLLNDIWPGAASSTPISFSPFGSAILFAARQQATGLELWKTSAVPAASETVLAKDICEGAGDSGPTAIFPFNGAAYFVATDCKTGHELWSHAGKITKLVKDIHVGAADSSPSLFAAGAHFLFFVADDGVAGPELWKTDGTAAGTVMVKDVRPGATGAGIRDVVSIGGDVVLFTASDGVSGQELWRSDGTAAGTTLVKDIWAGDLPSIATSLVVVRPGVVAFAASDGITGVEPWRSDGTAAGTTLVSDISPGPGSSNPAFMGTHGGKVYVSAYGPTGRELYASSAQAW